MASQVEEIKREPLGNGVYVCVSDAHRFGTDALLLADFARCKPNDLVCDLGTGCGIIPLVLHRDHAPRICYGVDIQPEATALLRRAAQEQSLGNLTAVEGDLRDLPEQIPRNHLTLVTCNPPYQPTGRGKLSAGTAQQIARHEICCDLAQVCRAAALLLRCGGRFCLCGRPERLCDAMAAMRAVKLEPKRLRFAAKNPESEPWLFLLEGKKAAKPFLRVEPTIFVWENGTLHPAVERLYRGDVPCGTTDECAEKRRT